MTRSFTDKKKYDAAIHRKQVITATYVYDAYEIAIMISQRRIYT